MWNLLHKLRRAMVRPGRDRLQVEPLMLPAHSPNLNAFAERWVRSVKEECLSKVILFGERSLRRALSEYVAHYHAERNHQGKSNVLLFPRITETCRGGPVQCREGIEPRPPGPSSPYQPIAQARFGGNVCSSRLPAIIDVTAQVQLDHQPHRHRSGRARQLTRLLDGSNARARASYHPIEDSFIARWTRMPHSIARLSASASSHHDLSLEAFITNIADSEFSHWLDCFAGSAPRYYIRWPPIRRPTISGRDTMIDNPDQVERLVAKLRELLPLFATVTPEVAAVVREQSPEADPSRRYTITRVDYAGDEGGIVCKVELGPENDDRALFASITHLRFGHAGPLARQIAAYQKHRVKRLGRFGQGSSV